MNPPEQDALGYKSRKANPSLSSGHAKMTPQPSQSPKSSQRLAQQEPVETSEPTEDNLLQQLERERFINKIALRIFQSADLDSILNVTVTEIQKFLQADRVAVERYSADVGIITMAIAVASDSTPNPAGTSGEADSSSSDMLQQAFQNLWRERSTHLYQQGLNEVVEDLDQRATQQVTSPRQLELDWKDVLQARARLAVPILRDRQLWGVLAVQQQEPRAWKPSEVKLLEQLTTQLAIAIHHSELHHEIQHLNDHLESEVQSRTLQLQQSYEFENTLKRITDRVRDSLDVDLILQAAIRELALVMKVRGCNASLYELEEGTSTTCYEYTSFLSPYQGRVAKFSAAQALYDQLLAGECFQFCSLIPNPERGNVVMLACPILDEQGVIGDLWVIHDEAHAFSDQDIRLVKQVANQCSIAIRQARLYATAQAEVRTLERLNQLKDDFLSTVSHELRTPLSNIKMAIHMLRTASNPERQQCYLQILEAECSRETELINDLLDLQRLENESYRVVPEPINLQEWLPGILAPFVSRAQSRQQHLRINLPADVPEVMSDRKSLERILAELLNNACKYTSMDGAIALRVEYTPSGDPKEFNLNLSRNSSEPVDITTFVISNEADIPTAEIPRMFEKFYRIPKSDPWQQGGTGLGLALIKKLVEMLQGCIEADSRDGWTILTVHLPMLEGSRKDIEA